MASQKILTTSLVPENISVYTGIWQASMVLKLYWGTNASRRRHVIAYESACSSFSFVSACFDVFKFYFHGHGRMKAKSGMLQKKLKQEPRQSLKSRTFVQANDGTTSGYKTKPNLLFCSCSKVSANQGSLSLPGRSDSVISRPSEGKWKHHWTQPSHHGCDHGLFMSATDLRSISTQASLCTVVLGKLKYWKQTVSVPLINIFCIFQFLTSEIS